MPPAPPPTQNPEVNDSRRHHDHHRPATHGPSRDAQAHRDALTPTMWRVTGALALAHVVVVLAAITQEPLAEHGQSARQVFEVYQQADLTRAFAGGYLEAGGFLILIPATVLVNRALGRRTALSRVAAQTFLASGVALVASTLAVGFPAGAAALYASQHGADPATVLAVNEVRNFAFVLQVALSCAMALALGVAALAERTHVRWIGWGGIAVGGAGLVATPFAHDAVSLLWTVWWVGLAVLFLRGEPEQH